MEPRTRESDRAPADRHRLLGGLIALAVLAGLLGLAARYAYNVTGQPDWLEDTVWLMFGLAMAAMGGARGLHETLRAGKPRLVLMVASWAMAIGGFAIMARGLFALSSSVFP